MKRYFCGECGYLEVPGSDSYNDGDGGFCTKCKADSWIELEDFDDPRLMPWIEMVSAALGIQPCHIKEQLRDPYKFRGPTSLEPNTTYAVVTVQIAVPCYEDEDGKIEEGNGWIADGFGEWFRDEMEYNGNNMIADYAFLDFDNLIYKTTGPIPCEGELFYEPKPILKSTKRFKPLVNCKHTN